MARPEDPDRISRQDLESSIQLFEKARIGDAVALDQLYSRYLPRLRLWASGRLPTGVRGMQETQDIVQDVLQNFLRKLDRFEPKHPGALRAYLQMMLLNRIRDLARRHKIRPDKANLEGRDFAAAEASPYEQLFSKEVRERYETGLMRLNEEERSAVILKLELNYGPTDIAQVLDKASADAARMYTNRAILKLAREMGYVRPT